MSRRLVLVLLVISLLAMSLGGCAKPLTLSITSPMDGKTVDKSSVTVRGNVSNPKATVWVNDTKVTVKKYTKGGGRFSTEIDLNEGINIIKVVATRGEEVVTKTVAVTYAPPLSLQITSPEARATLTERLVTVSGTVSDPEATITVNDVEVEVAEDGTFSADVELTEGINRIKVVATRGEEVVTKTVAVTYSSE